MKRPVLIYGPLLLIACLAALFIVLLLKPPVDPVPPGELAHLPSLPLDLPVGQPAIVNIFASWCVPCAAEAPLLARLATGGVKLYGLDYRDTPAGLAGYLQRNGNPFAAIVPDDGRAAAALGLTGVPETFLIAPDGTIVAHARGAIGEQQVAQWLDRIAQWR